MKIMVDGAELINLSEMQKKVLCNDIPESMLDADLKRRLNWVLMHKYEQSMKRLRSEWEPKLKASGAKSIPCDDDEFCTMIFGRPDYKDRAAREAESIKKAV